VIREYPHDIKAYTQGLEFHDGFLFESTGNKGESSLRKVDPETGEILKFRNLSSEFFGEGLTLLNNKIYQITYRSQVGFVYDAETFELQNKIYYQNKEGWGLSNDGESIIMSDGSHIIYFMDTTYFSVERKIEVFDNTGEVEQLNELELINGTLYANLYTLNDIVMIDPATGKVTGRIDMSGLLKSEDRHSSIDYFNGIAWDAENKRIFVTGKYWPKLYHVEFIEK
jgi:glutamine cyclotransferase